MAAGSASFALARRGCDVARASLRLGVGRGAVSVRSKVGFRAKHTQVARSHVSCAQLEPKHPCATTCPCFENVKGGKPWPVDFSVDSSTIAEYANCEPTPLRLEEVLAMRDTQGTMHLLQKELKVRLAIRIAHLDSLEDVETIEALRCARARLVRSFQDVRDASLGNATPEEFVSVIKMLKLRHSDQIQRLTQGMQEMKRLRTQRGEAEEEAVEVIDSFLNRFVLSRIGIEMLNSQYLALFKKKSGIVDPHCDPCAIAKLAASHARRIAMSEFDFPLPEVEISFFGLESARTLPLVPSYLLYILMELLKNSFGAVGEKQKRLLQAGLPAGQMDPIVIRVASDEAQVVLDIFDRGGGIPFQHQPHIWSYMYSTRSRSAPDGNEACTPLGGFGVGLPLSRLYAEYIGGSLHLMSMPNFGTHAFLFLQRCSSRKEGMPTYVNWLRKRALLDELHDMEARKRAAADIEDYAEALRLKGLAAEARGKLTRLDRWG
mmetsp:Transcript_44325/g.80324  ORF Transcript_44325/g.80324 Transcript_44325/m.80324 type:complete len:490 (-) Transcript_44325:279-1748(-)